MYGYYTVFVYFKDYRDIPVLEAGNRPENPHQIPISIQTSVIVLIRKASQLSPTDEMIGKCCSNAVTTRQSPTVDIWKNTSPSSDSFSPGMLANS